MATVELRSVAPHGARRADSLTRAAHVAAASRDGETVLLDVHRGRYHLLNSTASRVWELLDRPTTVAALAQAICDEHELPADATIASVEQDVERLTRELVTRGLICVQPDQ
jgi:hypothetical protein